MKSDNLNGNLLGYYLFHLGTNNHIVDQSIYKNHLIVNGIDSTIKYSLFKSIPAYINNGLANYPMICENYFYQKNECIDGYLSSTSGTFYIKKFKNTSTNSFDSDDLVLGLGSKFAISFYYRISKKFDSTNKNLVIITLSNSNQTSITIFYNNSISGNNITNYFGINSQTFNPITTLDFEKWINVMICFELGNVYLYIDFNLVNSMVFNLSNNSQAISYSFSNIII